MFRDLFWLVYSLSLQAASKIQKIRLVLGWTVQKLVDVFLQHNVASAACETAIAGACEA